MVESAVLYFAEGSNHMAYDSGDCAKQLLPRKTPPVIVIDTKRNRCHFILFIQLTAVFVNKETTKESFKAKRYTIYA